MAKLRVYDLVQLSKSEIARAARAFALGSVLKSSRLHGGMINSSYYLRTQDGDYVLRIYNSQRKFCTDERQRLHTDSARAFISAFEAESGSKIPMPQLLDAVLLNCFRYFAYTLPKSLDEGGRVDLNCYYQRIMYYSDPDTRKDLDFTLVARTS